MHPTDAGMTARKRKNNNTGETSAARVGWWSRSRSRCRIVDEWAEVDRGDGGRRAGASPDWYLKIYSVEERNIWDNCMRLQRRLSLFRPRELRSVSSSAGAQPQDIHRYDYHYHYHCCAGVHLTNLLHAGLDVRKQMQAHHRRHCYYSSLVLAHDFCAPVCAFAARSRNPQVEVEVEAEVEGSYYTNTVDKGRAGVVVIGIAAAAAAVGSAWQRRHGRTQMVNEVKNMTPEGLHRPVVESFVVEVGHRMDRRSNRQAQQTLAVLGDGNCTPAPLVDLWTP